MKKFMVVLLILAVLQLQAVTQKNKHHQATSKSINAALYIFANREGYELVLAKERISTKLTSQDVIELLKFGASQPITSIDLHQSDISKFPSFIEYTGLKCLKLYGNKITSVPEEFTRLTSLEEVDLHNNDIEDASPIINMIDHLTNLDLSENKRLKLSNEDISKILRRCENYDSWCLFSSNDRIPKLHFAFTGNNLTEEQKEQFKNLNEKFGHIVRINC